MASGYFKGFLWCNDGTSGDPTAYFFNQGGVAATDTNAVPVSQVYLWRGNTGYCVQFKFQTNGANAKQAGWNTFDTSTAGARGSRGLAFGVFEIRLGGTRWLFMPERVFGYFDGSTTVTCFVNCPAPLVS